MEVDSEPIRVSGLASQSEEKPNGGLDSDDETLRFDQDDDLYGVDADAEDAKWVALQHRPASEGEKEDEDPSAKGKSKTVGDENDGADSEADEDETVVDEPPTISGRTDAPRENQQQHGGGGGGGSSSSNNKKEERAGALGVASDAQLSCPLCFTTVCLECQRHAKYSNQFRAVIGINVTVKHDVFLTLDQVSGGGGGGGGGGKRDRKQRTDRAAEARDSGNGMRQGTGAGGEGRQEEQEEEMFHPVCCGECDHRVGVYDAEEVFHFFGVVASG